MTESTLDGRFTTGAILDQEAAIASAHRRFAIPAGPGNIHADGLDRAQLDVARAVAGTAQLVLVVGPAGTGKTTALRPAVAALQAHGRSVIGLAPVSHRRSRPEGRDRPGARRHRRRLAPLDAGRPPGTGRPHGDRR